MKRKDIDFSQGDEDIVFIETDVDTEEIAENEDPHEALIEEMESKGLKLENAPITAMFSDEFAVHLQEDSQILIDGKQVYPRD